MFETQWWKCYLILETNIVVSLGKIISYWYEAPQGKWGTW